MRTSTATALVLVLSLLLAPGCDEETGGVAGEAGPDVSGSDGGVAGTWAVGGGGIDSDDGRSIAVDSSGNVYVAGIFRNPSATFGTLTVSCKGKEDIFVLKLSAAGQVQWVRTMGGSGWEYGAGLAVDSAGNAYVTGGFTGQAALGATKLTSRGSYDMFVAKLSPSGQPLWVAQAGQMGSAAEGRAIALDGSSDLYVTGYFSGGAAFGTSVLSSKGNYDLFVTRISTSGVFAWASSAGGTGDDMGRGVAADSSKNALITGSFEDQVAFGTTTLSAKSSDILVAKLSPSGKFVWASSAGGTGGDDGMDIAVDAAGNSFITGSFEGTAAFGSTSLSTSGFAVFVSKVSPAGQFAWASSNSGGSASGHGITVGPKGNAYLTGAMYDNLTFGSTTLARKGLTDLFVARASSSGTFTWATSVGGGAANFILARDVAADADHLYVTGDYRDPTTFGTKKLTSYGLWDAFAWKLAVP